MNNAQFLRSLLSFRPTSATHRMDLKVDDVVRVSACAREMLSQEPVLLELPHAAAGEKTVFVGDIHGQLHDLLRVLHSQKLGAGLRYVFLGDIVDRGQWSIECVTIVFLLKLCYPQSVFLLRGNHECPLINRVYGFRDECLQRYGNEDGGRVWAHVNAAFQMMPLCADVAGRIFCTHGGISKDLLKKDSLKTLNSIDRNAMLTIPSQGLACDLTWADPVDPEDKNKRTHKRFAPSDRGCSVVFSESVAQEFCAMHGFDFVCRAHQMVQDGYEFFANRCLVTVFSASNYCGSCGNSGAVLIVDSDMNADFATFMPLSVQFMEHPSVSAEYPYYAAGVDEFFSTTAAANPQVLHKYPVYSSMQGGTVGKTYDPDQRRARSAPPRGRHGGSLFESTGGHEQQPRTRPSSPHPRGRY